MPSNKSFFSLANLKILPKLLLFMLVLSWVPLTVSIGLGISARNDAITNQMENTILGVISGAAQDIRQGTTDMLMENVSVLQQILLDPTILNYALNPDEEGLSEVEMEEAVGLVTRLQALTAATASLEEIVIHDANGVVLISSGLGNIGQDNSSRADMQDVLGGSTFSESIVITGRDSTPNIFISIPLANDEGVTGVVSLKLQAEFINTFINEVSGEGGMNIYVIDTNGVILAESEHNSDWVYRSAVELPYELAAQYETSGSDLSPEYSAALQPLYHAVEMAFETGTTGRFDFCHPESLDMVSGEGCKNGEWSQVAYEIVPDPINDTPLFLVLVEVMEGPYQTAARQQTLLSIFSALLLGVFLVAASVFVARSMASPIQRMAEAAQKVENEVPFEPESLEDISAQGDEVGMLSRVFSDMVVALQKRERALKREVRRLRIQIDEKKKQAEGDEISGQEFFQDLQKKAKGFKKNRKESDGKK